MSPSQALSAGRQAQTSSLSKTSESAASSSAASRTRYHPGRPTRTVPPAAAMRPSSSPFACWLMPTAKVRTPRLRSSSTCVSAASSSWQVSSPSVIRTTASPSSGSPNASSTPSKAAAMGVCASWSGAAMRSNASRLANAGGAKSAAAHPSATPGKARTPRRASAPKRSATSSRAARVKSQRPPALMLEERSTRKSTSGDRQRPEQTPSAQLRPSPQGTRREGVVHPGASGSGRQRR